MINITKRNVEEEEFIPHMAMTHMEINGGACNAHNKPLSLKSNKTKPLTKSTLAAIEKLEGKEGVIKASYNNLCNMLQYALRIMLYEKTLEEDYPWVYIIDFDTSVVVFEHQDVHYATQYELSETGTVLVSSNIKGVVKQTVYVTDDEKSLVLKYKNPSNSSGEINTKSNPNEGKNDMSKELEDQIVELKKAVSNQEEAIAQAVTKALEAQAIAVEKEALTASTAEIVKGFNAVEEADQVALVKSLVGLGDEAALIIKAFSNMQEQVIKANADLVLANESAETIKKEFSNSSDDEGVSIDATQLSANKKSMKEAVALAKARQKS